MPLIETSQPMSNPNRSHMLANHLKLRRNRNLVTWAFCAVAYPIRANEYIGHTLNYLLLLHLLLVLMYRNMCWAIHTFFFAIHYREVGKPHLLSTISMKSRVSPVLGGLSWWHMIIRLISQCTQSSPFSSQKLMVQMNCKTTAEEEVLEDGKMEMDVSDEEMARR